MAATHGKNSYVKIGTVVLSSQVNSVSVDANIAADDATPLGVENEVVIAGLGSGAIAAAGFYDSTNASTLAGYLGTSQTWEYGPAGNTTGSTKFSGSCIVTAVSHQSTPTAAVALTLTAKRTGAQTVGTY